MAQLHRLAHGDSSKSLAPTIATVEQFLRGGEASKAAVMSSSPSSSSVSNERSKNRGGEASKVASSSSSSSMFNERSKNRDTEEDHSPRQKKSVLSKVKEKAKKWRHSLSKKKHEDNSTPSLGEEDDEDSEYLGAPMYESEQAPEACKEKARQHPRASPVIPEKRVLSSSVKTVVERDKEMPLSPSKSKRIMAHPPATTTHHPAGPSKTMSDNNKAAPSSSKSKNLSVSKPTELQVSSEPSASRKASSALSSPKAPRAKTASSQTFYDASMPPHASSAPVTPCGGDKSSSRSDLIWDKGISVREYLKNMFEPGEEERALSEVISEVMSPRKTPEDKGVMEKVQDAVTSLLLNDEPSQHAVHSLSTSSEIPIPVSTNAYEVGQEESQGRILQAN